MPLQRAQPHLQHPTWFLWKGTVGARPLEKQLIQLQMSQRCIRWWAGRATTGVGGHSRCLRGLCQPHCFPDLRRAAKRPGTPKMIHKVCVSACAWTFQTSHPQNKAPSRDSRGGGIPCWARQSSLLPIISRVIGRELQQADLPHCFAPGQEKLTPAGFLGRPCTAFKGFGAQGVEGFQNGVIYLEVQLGCSPVSLTRNKRPGMTGCFKRDPASFALVVLLQC